MHTPGPWFIGKVEPRREFDGWTDAGGCRIDANGVEQLCYVWNTSERLVPAGEIPPPFGSDNAEADARLIAAAPELLSVAIKAEALISGELVGVEWKRACAEFVKAARAAIAKATGEQ